MSFENLMQKAAQIRAKAHSLAQVDVPPGIDDPILHQGIVEETRRRAAGVPATFEPLTGLPDPAKFASAISDLGRAMDRLGTGQDIVSIADATFNRLDSLYANDSNDAVVVFTATASLIGVAAAAGSASVGVLLAVLGGPPRRDRGEGHDPARHGLQRLGTC